MKQRADKSRREVEFKVGDRVYVKLRPYRQQSLARRMNEKLSARYYSPFPIEARVGPVAYKLKLPAEAKIHPTFNVSQLKLAVGDTVESAMLPFQLSREGVIIVEPEKVMSQRVNPKSGHEELLVKWVRLPIHDCSWE